MSASNQDARRAIVAAQVKSKRDFGIESYKQIRAEVAVLLVRIENLFRYSLLATAGVFSWLLTQAFGTMDVRPASGVPTAETCFKLPHEAMLIAWWIPTAFVVLSGVITLATHIRIMQMSGYLRMCECALGYEKLSWEAYIGPMPPLFFRTTAFAWFLLLGASLGVALIGIGIRAAVCLPK